MTSYGFDLSSMTSTSRLFSDSRHQWPRPEEDRQSATACGREHDGRRGGKKGASKHVLCSGPP